VPFSTLEANYADVTFGPAQTTAEMLQAAVAKYDTVLATTTATAAQRNLASVGRGRALLNLGRFADAAAAVAAVPVGFVFNVEHSDNSPQQQNAVWTFANDAGRWGVAEREGANGLPFVSAGDPRAPTRVAVGFDGGPRQEQLKDSTRVSPKVLADGVEAELIKAEAALRAGGDFVAILNALCANPVVRTARGYAAPGGASDPLPATLADPGTAAAREDLLFRERAFWLFATAHRLGDMRRLVRQYGRAPATVFPSGSYSSNGRLSVYGTDVDFPIPIQEGNNGAAPSVSPEAPAELKGCLDRNA
jgi:hypothetical protein